MKKIKQKNRKKLFIFIILIALLVFVALYFFFNISDDNNNLSIIEKQWIEKNKQNLIDINVVNGVSVISDDGMGILFDFMNDFENDTGLEFNKVSYDYSPTEKNKDDLGFVVVSPTDNLTKKDLLIWEDDYLVLGKENNRLENLSDMKTSKVGVLASDRVSVNKVISNTSVNVVEFNSISTLLSALENKNISYVIIPNYIYLKYSSNVDNVYVNYHISDISNKIALRLGSSAKINTILTKYLATWKKNNIDISLAKSLLEYYYDNNSVTDIERKELTSKTYTYGYVDAVPYSFVENKVLYGIAGEYINILNNSSDIEFNYIKYRNRKELKEALDDNKVDVAFIDVDYNKSAYLKTSYVFREQLAILSKRYQMISSVAGLSKVNTYTLEDSHLFNYLKKEVNKDVKTVASFDSAIANEATLVVDLYEYLPYKSTTFSKYNLLAIDTYDDTHTFVVKDSEETLYKLFNFILEYSNFNYYSAKGLNSINLSITDKANFEVLYIVILSIILIPIFILLFIKYSTRSIFKKKIIKKEEILKYTDMLTSLKNRNYLNKNLSVWDEMEYYPRSIVVIDLNNLKYVNDNHGHDEGNKLIVKAASVLINTQLEKSEIIRSDGNEFLIYMIGYTEKQVITYTNKLQKEMEKLPYGFGAAIGYSIINDKLKNIDDAINEATIMMRDNKQQNNK